jgi:aminoglycoside phosphotransferase (APT) family kinase protein
MSIHSKSDSGTKDFLHGFVRSQPQFENATVENLHIMPGGASKETWAFDLHRSDAEVLPMVLRIERTSPLPASIDLQREFLLIKEVHAEGIRVPRPYWSGVDSLGSPFCVLERIEGETIVRRLHRDAEYEEARSVMSEQLGRILADIHRVPITKDRFDFVPRRSESGSSAVGELLFYEKLLHLYAPEPHPALELALRWLKANAPQSKHHVLLHGDYRLGNVIFTHDGVRSILDWELSHIGDPVEDVGYISVQAWRFGNDSKPIGGIGDREDFYNAYEKASGFPLDLNSIHFWEVFGNLKWAIITILQMVPFLNGSSGSIELASLGRKTAEVELQLLTLIEG